MPLSDFNSMIRLFRERIRLMFSVASSAHEDKQPVLDEKSCNLYSVIYNL